MLQGMVPHDPVCDCNRLTRADIARAIAAGAARPAEVYARCGGTAQCGRCLDVIRAMLAPPR